MARGVTNEEFVVAWMTNETVADVAKALKIGEGTVQVRASNLRKAGVSLPHKKRLGTPIPVEKLNRLVKKHSKS